MQEEGPPRQLPWPQASGEHGPSAENYPTLQFRGWPQGEMAERSPRAEGQIPQEQGAGQGALDHPPVWSSQC